MRWSRINFRSRFPSPLTIRHAAKNAAPPLLLISKDVLANAGPAFGPLSGVPCRWSDLCGTMFFFWCQNWCYLCICFRILSSQLSECLKCIWHFGKRPWPYKFGGGVGIVSCRIFFLESFFRVKNCRCQRKLKKFLLILKMQSL